MARTKEFDPDQALQAAMELFWQRGYEATSMSDLVQHLGIGRASIYATFGGKRELYLKAYERYLEQGIDFEGLLSKPGPVLPAVRDLVRRFADEAAHDTVHRGCLVVNTAVELAPHDEELASRVESNWNFIENTLASALTRAREQRELDEGQDPRSLARFLLTVLQGLRLVGKGSNDAARLRDTARQALRVLDLTGSPAG
ncbi:TetR/AcrR family transcriptional regulator [Nonomuraea africana]|uniref:TetR/AcrR family transcriptional repressor of nem operon n=1 Tax=Nonomuraea africana TaxID=46171 RepID=A0ABR9KKV0_9ACTN|nr:TetR/AcrR family transcriptional regulator [Nonomuraea africana]MBE1562644.1 TetR/AcrR family transcriptional repressor of nem operon [Nonomuraea africana]